MKLWHAWASLAVLFLILEMFTPSFFLACFGAAFIAVAIASALNASATVQLVVFSATTLFFFFIIRPLVLRLLYRHSSQVATNVEALPGKIGIVSDAIDQAKNKGRVKVNGDDWKALSEKDTMVPEGTKVKVLRIDGTKLWVEPLNADKEEK